MLHGSVCSRAPGLVGADGHRVIPGGEPFVTVGVLRGIDQHDGVPEDIQRGRLIGGQQLIRRLHGRFEPRRLVPVHRMVQEHHRRIPVGDGARLRRRRAARIGQGRQVGPDAVEPGQVLRRGDDQEAHHPSLDGAADDLRPHPVRGRLDQPVQHRLLLVVGRLLGAQRVPQQAVHPRHGGTVRPPGIEIELPRHRGQRRQDLLLGRQDGRHGEEQGQGEELAHEMAGQE